MKLINKVVAGVTGLLVVGLAHAEVPATVTAAFSEANTDIATVAWGLAVVAFIGTTIRIIRNRA
ncbi:MAG: hypothetical protein ACT6RZ_11550 [Methylophilus sp.]|uniref:hypothetical protein n=1 Tax=Methylophilus sp. TaxID=29541 RepID=UPI0040355CC5